MSNQGEGPQSTADLTAFVSASPIPSERADGPLRKDRPRGSPPTSSFSKSSPSRAKA